MTQRHSVTRWLGALGLILALVGLVSQGTTGAQTSLAETRQRAHQGDAVAQFNFALMYRAGEGVPQDDTQAVAWFRQAADQGLAAAQYNLGNLYANGRGVPQDDARAAAWYHQAADQDLAAAQYKVAVMYITGQDLPQDDVEAHRWLSLATSRATSDEQLYAATRDALAKRMTSAQLAEAQKRAADWQAAFEKRQAE